jgi:hypothetical protein
MTRFVLLLAVAAIPTSSAASRADLAGSRPNVLVILCDDKYGWREDDRRRTPLRLENLCISSADRVSFRAATAAANSAESMAIAVN